jgi:pyruvate ferredoxin oxidoreductase gamma subunit
MRELTEIRWHARAGQGAKTAAQLLALALLRAGRSVQAFPEYGPERRGAPLRAFTRVAGRPIRRHDTITEPDLVVVLDPRSSTRSTLRKVCGSGPASAGRYRHVTDP